jgi:hypothetical protein
MLLSFVQVHRQPLYSGYNQAYEESIRNGDIYRKQVKRSTRLPPEVKQKLLPHEEDQQNQVVQQHAHPYGSMPGFSQPMPTGPQPVQPYTGIRPPYNPYQAYGAPPGYFGPSTAGSAPYTAVQAWPSVPVASGSSEQEIQRLRSHIHTLEGELHKLQRKLNKAALNTVNNEVSEQNGRNQDETTRSNRQSKRDEAASPRQTPVIVELNNATGDHVRESSSKKHRHRTASNNSSQQPSNQAQSDSSSIQRSTIAASDNATASGSATTTVQSSNLSTTSDARES